MNNPIYIFAGGGTGGHLYPGLAVAERLMELRPDARIVFACSGRPIDRRILDPLSYGVVPQAVLPMPRSLRGWGKFFRAWRTSSRQARDMVAELKPAAVLGLGGYAAAPVVRSAARRGIPSAMLNPDAVAGAANRYLARRVDAIFTQFDSTAGCFGPKLRTKVRAVGCPGRPGLTAPNRPQGLKHFELRDDRRTLLVLGGSLGAANINRALTKLSGDLAALADTWQVLHVAGPASPGQDDTPISAPGLLVRRLEYCHEMPLAYAAADLALCRGGASTIAELAITATPAVIMPYPYHRDQQQKLNAGELVGVSAAVLCEDLKDPVLNAEALRRTLLPLMKSPEQLPAMRHAAAKAARPHAAAEVAAWLVSGGRQ